MRSIYSLILLCFAAVSSIAGPASACADRSIGLPVARVVEIDASSGPLYGDLSRYAREDTFLKPKEVVLTFDDGPMPWITKSILDTLDRYCTKATFFAVGQMALAYPGSVKEIMARGHTLGTHTWSHPLNLRAIGREKAIDQIERGFAAVALAAGQPIAPFFRFPGLSDSDPLLAHLQTRGVASFTVDVVSNDSYIGDAGRLAQYTIRQIEARQGGIVLFHDIKAATAKALPTILAALKDKGYTVVHLRSKTTFAPKPEYAQELGVILAKAEAQAAKQKAAMMPFYGTVIPGDTELPVTQLAPTPRVRVETATARDDAPAPSRRRHSRAGAQEPQHGEGKRRRRGAQKDSEVFPSFFD